MTNIDSAVFNIDDLFNLSTGANIPNSKLKDGKIPRISAKGLNNGVQQYTNVVEDSNFRTSNNFISISFLGDSFYHPYLASVDMKIHILKLKNIELNKYLGLYLTTTLNNQMNKYDYGNQLSLATLKKGKILLPINCENEPDFEYMENIMINIEKEQIKKYIDYLGKINNNVGEGETLDDVKYKKFYLNEIFEDIQRGKRLTKANFIAGETPYVSSSAESNGIDAFIGNEEKVRIFEDCITLANSGSVGSTFYHPYKFVASDHVTHLKHDSFNKYIYLFLASIIKRLKSKYNFNREINDNRLKREVIILPITENGDIDYKFIEEYMMNLEAEMINKYLKYLKGES